LLRYAVTVGKFSSFALAVLAAASNSVRTSAAIDLIKPSCGAV